MTDGIFNVTTFANPEKEDDDSWNYLGLEIRPSVAQYARDRIQKWNANGVLEFIGCNANVDLDRLLRLYQTAAFNESSYDKKKKKKTIDIDNDTIP